MSPDLPVRAAIYARVSSEEQKEGQTIDSQISELERFAQEKKWVVLVVYKDEGWSGALLARPELDHLRDEASKGTFDVVLINDIDRLARDVSHLGIVKRDLERHGVQVVFKKLPTDQSPTYNLMINILGSFAEFERELITDRTRRGRRHKVEVRKQYIGSNPPYGYRYIPKDRASGKDGFLEIAPEEAAVIRQMFEWVDKEGLSAQKVTTRLSEMRVPPRKGGKSWGISSVIRILRSETYAGTWHYNKYEGCAPVKPNQNIKYRKSLKGSLRRRPKSEWLPVELPSHLRLIERDRWERVQDQLVRNTTFSPRNAIHNYLLKGLIVCAGCGARFVGDPCHQKYYYRCANRCKKVPTIREEMINDLVWNAITEMIRDPSIVEAQVEKLYQHREDSIDQGKSEAREIEAAMQQLDTEQTRLLEAYREGFLPVTVFGKEMRQITIRREALEVRKKKLQAEIDSPPFSVVQKSLADYCQIASSRINKFDKVERQQFIRTLVNKIIYERGRIRIKGLLPVSRVERNKAGNGEIPQEQEEFFASRIASTMTHSDGRNTKFSSGGIANITSYSDAHNPATEVEGISFEISQIIPRVVTIYEQIDLEYVREQVRQNPLVTLQELADSIHQQFGVKPSITHMLRIQQLAGISRIPGSRAKQVMA